MVFQGNLWFANNTTSLEVSHWRQFSTSCCSSRSRYHYGIMPESNAPRNKEFRKDLIELLMEPLSAQIEQARLQILQKIGAVESLIEILARQVRRDIDEQS